jgi:hypothetical protein
VITEEEFAVIVDQLLEVGVPPTAVARAFQIDPLVVKDRINELRVEKYGAAELAEATAQMQWEALAQARAMIHDAPYNVRVKFIQGILGRTMSLTARQSPETVGNMRRDLQELYQQLVTPYDDDLADADPDAFVAVSPAHDDQDQGPDH